MEESVRFLKRVLYKPLGVFLMGVGKVSKKQSFKRLLIKFAAKSFLAFIGVQGFVY